MPVKHNKHFPVIRQVICLPHVRLRLLMAASALGACQAASACGKCRARPEQAVVRRVPKWLSDGYGEFPCVLDPNKKGAAVTSVDAHARPALIQRSIFRDQNRKVICSIFLTLLFSTRRQEVATRLGTGKVECHDQGRFCIRPARRCRAHGNGRALGL